MICKISEHKRLKEGVRENMAKVFYIPYAKYELQSELSKEQLIEQISSQISNHNIISEYRSKNKGKYSGAINMSTGRFKIRKRLNHRNQFNSNVEGQIIEGSEGTKIVVTLKLPTFAYIFLTLFCSIWLAIDFSNLNGPEGLLEPLGGLVFVYGLTFFGFNIGAGSALDTLHEII